MLYLFSGFFAYKIEAPFIDWLTRVTELKPKPKTHPPLPPPDLEKGERGGSERDDQPMVVGPNSSSSSSSLSQVPEEENEPREGGEEEVVTMEEMAEDVFALFQEALHARGRRVSFEQDVIVTHQLRERHAMLRDSFLPRARRLSCEQTLPEVARYQRGRTLTSPDYYTSSESERGRSSTSAR